MKITILCNDIAKVGFLSEHGLSLLIDDETIFDAGSTNVAVKNAEKLGIDFSRIKRIFVSHGHYDHVGGLLYFLRKIGKVDLYIHRKALAPKYSGTRFAGPSYDWRDIEEISNVHMLDGDVVIDGFKLINKVKFNPNVIDKRFNVNGIQDTFEDEINLFKDGILLTGCAHRGIEYILEEVSKNHNVHTVVGGFHLKDSSKTRIERVAIKFQKRGVKVVPLHCTGKTATEFFKHILKEKCILKSAGDVISV